MKIIYLCGGINNLTDKECKDWREYVKKQMNQKYLYSFLDPTRRDYRGKEKENIGPVVNGDYYDIKNSDIILVNAEKASWGTAMELHHAFVNEKKYVVVFSSVENPSPWLQYHCHFFAKNIDEALSHIRKLNESLFLKF